jgi:hypothetical protein
VFAAVFGTLGIGVIGLLPLWLMGPPAGKASRVPTSRVGAINRAPTWFAIYGGAFVLVWFALTHQTRYLIPILPLLLVPSVAGVRAFWRAGLGWRIGLGAFCSIAILWGLLPLYTLVQPCFAVAWGGETRDAYLSRVEPIYNVCVAANRDLPAGAKVLLLNEVRGFYLDPPYQWGDWSQSTVIPWDRLQTVEDMDVELAKQGITHVLVNWGPTPSPSEGWPALAKAAIERGRWAPVIEQGRFTVYVVAR